MSSSMSRAVFRSSSRTVQRRSSRPATPCIMPYTLPAPRLLALSYTPARLALMTAVGPPDWPTIAFFAMGILLILLWAGVLCASPPVICCYQCTMAGRVCPLQLLPRACQPERKGQFRCAEPAKRSDSVRPCCGFHHAEPRRRIIFAMGLFRFDYHIAKIAVIKKPAGKGSRRDFKFCIILSNNTACYFRCSSRWIWRGTPLM